MEHGLMKAAIMGGLLKRLDPCNFNGTGDAERDVGSVRLPKITSTRKKWSQAFYSSGIVPFDAIDGSTPFNQLPLGASLKVKGPVKNYAPFATAPQDSKLRDRDDGTETASAKCSDGKSATIPEFSTVPSLSAVIEIPNEGLEWNNLSYEAEHNRLRHESYDDPKRADYGEEANVEAKEQLHARVSRGLNCSIGDHDHAHEERQPPVLTNDLHEHMRTDFERSRRKTDMEEQFTIASYEEKVVHVSQPDGCPALPTLAPCPEFVDPVESVWYDAMQENRLSIEDNGRATQSVPFEVKSAESTGPLHRSSTNSTGNLKRSTSFRRSVRERFRKLWHSNLLSVSVAFRYRGCPPTLTKTLEKRPVRFVGKALGTQTQRFTQLNSDAWDVQDLREAYRSSSPSNTEGRQTEAKCQLLNFETERNVLDSAQDHSHDLPHSIIKIDDDMKGRLINIDDDLHESRFEDIFVEIRRRSTKKMKTGGIQSSETVSCGAPLVRKLRKILRMSSKGFQGAKGIVFSVVQGINWTNNHQSFEYKRRSSPSPAVASRVALDQNATVDVSCSRGPSTPKRNGVSQRSSHTFSPKRNSASPAPLSPTGRRSSSRSEYRQSLTSSNLKSRRNPFSSRKEPGYTLLRLTFGKSESAPAVTAKSLPNDVRPELPLRERPSSTVESESAGYNGDSIFSMSPGRKRGRLAPSRFQREHLERLKNSAKVSPGL